MTHCPACGGEFAPGAALRSCPRCGSALPGPEGSTSVPAASVPAPSSTPDTFPDAFPGAAASPESAVGPTPFAKTPLTQTPAALFARRVLTGRWEWTALLPAAAMAVSALAIGALSGQSPPGQGIGFLTRTRAALALLVQGLGGSLTVSRHFDFVPFDDGDGTLGGTVADIGDFPRGQTFTSTYSVHPLTATLLWITVLVVVLLSVRRRQYGPEAAVRVAVAAAAGALALALIGRPELASNRIGSGPSGVAVWTFVISLVTALVVLCSPEVRDRLSARPGASAAVRVVGTAALALLLCVAAAGLAVFVIAVAHYDDLSGWGVAGAGLLVLNTGVLALGLSWGAPSAFRLGLTGDSGRAFFGLPELGDLWGGWAVCGALAGGVLFALLIGFLAVRRSRDRTEQFAVAGAFTVLFLLLGAIAGASAGNSGMGTLLPAGSLSRAIGPHLPAALIAGLLWPFFGVLAAPHLWRALGGKGMPAGAFTFRWGDRDGGEAPAPDLPAGGVPPQPSAAPNQALQPRVPPPPAQPPDGGTVHDLGIVQPPHLDKRDGRHR